MMIIVVEDDVHINQVVCEYLRDSGFEVASFADGGKAKEFIEGGSPADLFVFDIMLPRVTGLELLQLVRKSETHAQTPVVMLTALNDEDTQLASFEYLAHDYITKPFSPKILVKRVQALLRRPGMTSAALQLGGVEMDLARYAVSDRGESIKLTLKEFELLKTFMEHRQIVFSRQKLLDLVWGYDYFGDDRIVDAHIKNLRKKLKSDIIKTVKGVGYKGDADA
ncbi:MAG: response regulator transcription factor [Clostridiales Family XIII bacterium]|jgi:DNA-binding response OmpR family regulator|nr:response regulator transcription factor [Clostridiales Family XIII bacterium]